MNNSDICTTDLRHYSTTTLYLGANQYLTNILYHVLILVLFSYTINTSNSSKPKFSLLNGHVYFTYGNYKLNNLISRNYRRCY